MRIMKLRLVNLNSLAGEWVIDFTHPAYQAGGIFAITGPTGVGKTTILDAICLALYGETPRLKDISKTTNEIMTRGQGQCEVELTFETPQGRYRGHWSQHRARNKPGGALQDAQHRVDDDLTGQPLENSLKRTPVLVEKITGMNFKQFTRSMMLAQGAFAAFLEARPDERANLLEQITGAEVYSRISQHAYERAKKEKAKLEELTRHPAAQAPSEEEVKALAAEREAATARLADLARELQKQRAAADWLKKLADLEAEAGQLDAEEKALAGRRESFAPDEKRLTLDRKVLPLAGPHHWLTQVREQRGRAAPELAARRAELPAAEAAREATAEAAAKAEQAKIQAHEAEEKARPTLAQARALDGALRELAGRITPLAAELRDRLTELAALSGREFPEGPPDRHVLADIFTRMKTGLAEQRAALEARAGELAALLAGRDIPAWRDELTALGQREASLGALGREVEAEAQARRDLTEAEQRRQKVEEELAKAAGERQLAEEAVAGLEREEKLLTVQLELEQRIRSLEEHRSRLAPGEPCPLCGSPEHPYADPERLPVRIATEEELVRNRNRLKNGRKLITDLTGREAKLFQARANGEEAAARLQKEITRLDGLIRRQFAALGATEPEADRPAALSELKRDNQARLDRVNEVVKRAEPLNKELGQRQAAFDRAASAVERGERLLADAAEREAALAKDYQQREELRRERAGLLNGADSDAEEKKLRAALAAAEKTRAEAEKARQTAQLDHSRLHTRITETAARLETLEREVQAQAAAFQAELAAANLPDEAAYLAAVLPPAERERLGDEVKALAGALAGLAARREVNTAGLARERARVLTDRPPAELTDDIAAREAEQGALQGRREVVIQKLADHERAAQAHRELQGLIEAQKRECARWKTLDELIGSAGGQKYRNFVQGLTFELMVHQANRQLADLSDRYLLLPDPAQPLELKVMDNYQGGEIRSTRNLSGGESFLVSLALALGLSRMASQRVRVDSLFLDEGFGTLDEDALDVALETLAGLRADGKLIGVISHVPALIERVPTQIRVRPLHGPYSAVSGPGVSGDF